MKKTTIAIYSLCVSFFGIIGCNKQVDPPTEINTTKVAYRQIVRLNQNVVSTSNKREKTISFYPVIGVRTETLWSDGKRQTGPTQECTAPTPKFSCEHYSVTIRELVDDNGDLRERNDISATLSSDCKLTLMSAVQGDVKKIRVYAQTHFNGLDPCNEGFIFNASDTLEEMREIKEYVDYSANSNSVF